MNADIVVLRPHVLLRVISSVILAFACTALLSQPTGWQWSMSLDHSAVETIQEVAVDPVSGDIYVVGTYDHYSLLGLTPGPFGLPSSAGSTDAFIAKLNASGTVLWSKRLGGTGADTGNGIALGPNGKVYVTGSFRGSLVGLVVAGLLSPFTSAGNMDIFLACFDGNGTLEWIEKAGGPDSEFGYSLAVNGTGVFLQGQFRSTSQFQSITVTPPVAGKDHIFLAKYPLTGGEPHWVRQAVNSKDNVAGKVAANADGAFVTGSFKENHLSWRTPNNTLLSTVTCTNSNQNIYITSFNNAGDINWHVAVDEPGDQSSGNAIAVACNKVFITGRVHQSALFPGGNTVTHPGAHDFLYLAGLNASNGNMQWVRTAMGPLAHANEGLGLHVGKEAELYLSGTFDGSLQWDNNVQFTGASGQELFVSRFTVAGEMVWSRSETAPGGEWPLAIGSDDQGRVVVAGTHTGNITLSPSIHVGINGLNIFIGSLQDPMMNWPNNPSLWHMPGGICSSAGSFNMAAQLRGHGRTVTASTGVTQVIDILGAPDGLSASFNGSPAQLAIDVSDIILAGASFEFHWRVNSNATARAIIEYSMDGLTWTAHPTNPQTTSTSLVTVVLTAAQPFRFLRFRRPTGSPNAPFSIDAVTLRTSTLTNGTWSGAAISPVGILDLSGSAGSIPLSYTTAIGSCTWTTTREILVSSPPSATIIGPDTICLLSGPVVLNVSEIQPNTTIVAWETSIDGNTWVATGTADTVFTGIIEVPTAFRLKISGPHCGDTYSNTQWIIPSITATVTCPSDILEATAPDGCSKAVAYEVVAEDSCDLANVHYSHVSGYEFPVGITPVIVTMHFDSTALATCSFNVTVVDQQPPTISCPTDIITNAAIGQCGRNLTFEAQGSDNCQVPSITYSTNSGSFFALGTTPVTATTTDDSGNNASCTFSITVIDNDSDGDGILDCDDGCPEDPMKWAPGTCGCGAPEPGTPCDDGDPDTWNDMVQNDCSCAGQPIDCAGVPNGSATTDQCGTCVGGDTGLSPCVQDCNNEWGGSAYIDNCGDCVGETIGMEPCTADCNGDFGGSAVIDDCGNCVGGNTGETACIQDCNGDLGGSAVIDNCGTCVGGNTGELACIQDCNGDFGGSAVIDYCGNCVDGNTGATACTPDCNGDFGGSAVIDNCGNCVEGNTGATACIPDCNGDFGGSAVIDNCGNCVGGNTGATACNQDCNGDFGGTAVIDNCGTCVGGNTGEIACIQDCNGDFGGSAVIDNCGTCVSGNTGEIACIQDCNGDSGGSAVIDDCGNCVGGNTGETACIQDCNGDFGGSAVFDNCGNCVGGNTGAPACIQDCNGDFGGSALPGSPCDDGDPCTINDVLDNDCNCAGTPSIPDATFYYASETFCTTAPDPTPYIAFAGGDFTAISQGLIIHPTTGVIDLDASTPGVHTIQYYFGGDCPNLFLNTITIVDAPSSEWSAPVMICSNEEIALNALLAPGTIAGGIWSGPGINGAHFLSTVSNGEVPISYTAIQGDCSSTTTHTLFIQQAPVAFAGQDHSVCGYTINMQASTAGSGTWIAPDGVSVNAPNSPTAQISTSTLGTYAFIWSVTANGCTAQDHVNIMFMDPGEGLWADAGADQKLMFTTSTTLNGSTQHGAAVQWTVLEGPARILQPSDLGTGVTGLGDGINRFVLTARLGQCASRSDTVTVEVQELFIPEGFSPNNDGVNDLFEITGLDLFPGSALQVFNRWGQSVYASSDYRSNWDGRSNNGRELTNDTYFYVLNLSEGTTYKGSVIIKR